MQYLVGYVLSDISEESKQESSSSNSSVEVLNDRVVDKLELELQAIQPDVKPVVEEEKKVDEFEEFKRKQAESDRILLEHRKRMDAQYEEDLKMMGGGNFW
jgi:hypothetical protein